MATTTLFEYKEALYECAKTFRHDANFMMSQLAAEYNFEIKKGISFPREIYKHYNNKVIFRNEWSFFFHGGNCRFDNLNTGQILDIKFTNSPEFGHIDPYFFFLYMTTTDKFKGLEKVVTEDNIMEAVNMLLAEGLLIQKEDPFGGNLILAK